MQLIHTKVNRARYFIVIILAIALLNIWHSVSAQYDNGAYGSCAYGQTCPTHTEDNTTDTPPLTGNTPPAGTLTPEQSNQSEASRTETSSSPNSDRKSVDTNSGGQSLVSQNQPVDNNWFTKAYTRLSPVGQVLLPYSFWILLLILAIVLLIQAFVDRYKITKLMLQVEALESVTHERKNFLRLVSHYLNTPLTTIMGGLELVASTHVVTEVALSPLNSAAAELTALSKKAQADAAFEDTSSQQAVSASANPDRIRMKWYWFIPTVAALLLGFGVNYLLMQTGNVQPGHALLYQAAVAVAATLIFVNAVRMFTLSRSHKKMLKLLAVTIGELSQKRSAVLRDLSGSLHLLVAKFTEGLQVLAGQDAAKFVVRGVASLEDVSTKTRAATGWLAADESEVNVRDAVQQALDMHQAAAEERSLKITTHYDFSGSITTHIDDFKFIVENLISNAVAYNKDGGRVTVTVSQAKNQLTIVISDSGVGMTKKQLQELFHPFAKIGDVLTFDHSGIGLGLYASKQAALRLKGDIMVTSKKDVGTEFILTVPSK